MHKMEPTSNATDQFVHELLKQREKEISSYAIPERSAFTSRKISQNDYTKSFNDQLASTSSNSKLSVFERLAVSPKNKFEISQNSTTHKKKSFPHSHNQKSFKSSLNNSIKIEDKLMQFKKERDKKVCDKRKMRQNEEIKELKAYPTISPASKKMAQGYASAYGSMLDRFQKLETSREQKQITEYNRKIEADLEEVTGHPQVLFVQHKILDQR